MGYIFETEIETIMNTVRAKTIGESDSIELRAILNADIHPAIKAYFKNEVERNLQDDRKDELRSKRFRYALPEVMSLQRQIDLVLVNRYEFDRTEFETLLDQSVHFQFNYLCRPRWTLQSFVIGDHRRISAAEVLRKLRYCVNYEYFARVLKRYINERGLVEFSYEEFRSVIQKIDSAIARNRSPKELGSLMQEMLSFVVAGIPDSSNLISGPSLPINAAIVFFEDKEMLNIMSALEHERDSKEINQVSIEQLGRMLETILEREGRDEELTRRTEDAARTPEPAPSAVVTPEEVDAQEEREEPPSVEQLRPVVEHDLEKDLQKDLRSALEQAWAGSVQTQKRERKPKRKRKLKGKDFFSFFTPQEQKQFTKNLFGKDEAVFHSVLERLSDTADWEAAAVVLDAVFMENNIDPYDEDAIQFTDMIYDHFFPSRHQEEDQIAP